MDNKEKNFVSAVIYIRNNENEIFDFLNGLNTILDDNFDRYEIICVNDYSEDNSINIVKDFCKDSNVNTLSIINMGHFHGIEFSMIAGIDLAIGDFVFEFGDVFMDFDIKTIMQTYYKCLEGFDIVAASPICKEKLSSKLFYYILYINSNYESKFLKEKFRVLSRRAINRVYSMNKTIYYRKAAYHNCGLKIAFIKYDVLKNYYKKNEKLLTDNRREIAIDSLILFTDIASRLSFFLSYFMIILAFMTLIYTIFVFINNKPVAGWTTTMLFLSIAFFGVFVIFSIIIKYLSILVEFLFKKQKYVIQDIERL